MSAAVRRRLQSWELQKRYGAVRAAIASSLPARGLSSDLERLLSLGEEAKRLRQQIGALADLAGALPSGNGARPHSPAFFGSQKQETPKAQDVKALPQSIGNDAQGLHACGASRVCPFCGGRLIGDGYTMVRRCEFVDDVDGIEPDGGPVYCDGKGGAA